jgi:hypothetical protein
MRRAVGAARHERQRAAEPRGEIRLGEAREQVRRQRGAE